ncbi:MAG TPA: DmsE family decaheme c-type cytochrome [Bryobacteraceae bacterium]|jgi:DmsE family decaheme c-type cytochrome|nr:DmsE family decaheme c-type cytochrome [Bryobacteraceae bacterium]
MRDLWHAFLLATLLLLSAASVGAQNVTTNGVKTGYVGSTTCKTCHPDVWFRFYKNAHFKSVASGKESPENTGCEGCHGPGQAHVKASGGKATIVAFSVLSAKQTTAACLRCHGSDLARVNIHSSVHTQNGVSCTQCHSVHKAETPKALLAKPEPELCYGCHTNVRADFSMPFKHRVNEGFMVCSDCHNPHGTFQPTWRSAVRPPMVAQALANEEACLKCHSDKRGPFAFEHPPVRVEGCEMCHSPHGSTNSRLLTRPVVFTLCLECHNGPGTFGRSGTGVPSLSQAHNMADPRYRNCTNCHVRIHGSNADSLFLR